MPGKNSSTFVGISCVELFLIVFRCINVSFSSAIIEHTNQVVYMEDGDVASINNGNFVIYRKAQTGQDTEKIGIRKVHELKIELQQIMKGKSILTTIREINSPSYVGVVLRQATMNISCERKSLSNLNRW